MRFRSSADAGSPGSREERPEGEEWRADSLAHSHHSRLDAEISRPKEDFDEATLDACPNCAGELVVRPRRVTGLRATHLGGAGLRSVRA